MSYDVIGTSIYFFTVNTEKANKINYFLYYYIFSLYFCALTLAYEGAFLTNYLTYKNVHNGI